MNFNMICNIFHNRKQIKTKTGLWRFSWITLKTLKGIGFFGPVSSPGYCKSRQKSLLVFSGPWHSSLC